VRPALKAQNRHFQNAFTVLLLLFEPHEHHWVGHAKKIAGQNQIASRAASIPWIARHDAAPTV
jgi:hypothetical protein